MAYLPSVWAVILLFALVTIDITLVHHLIGIALGLNTPRVYVAEFKIRALKHD